MDKMKHTPLDTVYSTINYIVDIDRSKNTISDEEDNLDGSNSSESEPDSRIFEEIVNVAGYWGVHKFEKHPWDDRKRPRVYIKRFEELKLDDNEQAGILSERMIGTCLSYLEKSPVLLHYAYTKCVLSSKNLVDITALKMFNYIQYLDLSNNNLKTLEALGQLPFLQFLDASNNQIEKLLDFRAPYYLSHVNYNHNLIKELPDLSDFWSITYLKVANNNITQIKGLDNLKFMTHLNLSHNKITKLENLNHLRITTLILNDNLIDFVKDNEQVGLHTLSYLKTVDLSRNHLKNLSIFKGNEQLEKLYMSNNAVRNMLELYHLNQLRYLVYLNLAGNPISFLPYYHKGCLNILNRLKILDEEEIKAEDRVKSKFSGDIDPSMKARENRMELLLLQHINDPKIGTHIFPFDQPPPEVIMIVGPVASKKKEIASEFVKANRKAVLGINHTTCPRNTDETNEHYHYISENEFRTMLRNGEFIAVSESYGNFFGIASKELEKGENAVIVFCSDITSALTLKVMGICPKIVLAMPRTEETHMQWLKSIYFFECLDQNTIKITNNPDAVELSTITTKNNIIENENISELTELYEDSNSDSRDVSIKENLHICERQEYADEERNFYFHSEDNGSSFKRLSSDTDFKPMKEMSKSCTGILKNRSSIIKDTFKVTGVSFDADSPCVLASDLKKELSSKKVSFNWFPSMDWFDDDFLLEQKHRSISESYIISDNLSEQEPENEIPILSALSYSTVSDEHCNAKETVYMRLNEKLEQVQADNLKIFFKNVMKTRQELLDLYLSNPGLFRDIIFTDNRQEALAKLKELLKFTVEHHRDTKQKFSFENDPIFDKILKSKLDSLKLRDNIYVESIN